jgi:hypothetical protein
MTKIRAAIRFLLRLPHLASTALDASSSDWRRPAPGHSCLAFRIRLGAELDLLANVESW